MAAVGRVLVPGNCDDPATWKIALGYACALAAHLQSQEIVLLTHAKEQLQGSSLAAHLGDAAAKKLLANAAVPVAGGPVMRHITMRTTTRAPAKAVVIAYYADDKLLEFADGLREVAAIVAVTKFLDQVDKWTERWTPQVHNQAPKAPAVLIDDPVIEKALEHLTSHHSGKALLDPRDQQRVEETLRILRAKGHELLPDKIESWAIQKGWKIGAAKALAHEAGKVAKLARKPSLTAYHNPEGKYARWHP